MALNRTTGSKGWPGRPGSVTERATFNRRLQSNAKVGELIIADFDGDGSMEWAGTLAGKTARFAAMTADGKILVDRKEPVQRYSIVDWVDVDGDGAAELILEKTFSGGWTYEIFSGWRSVYTGGGGGC